MWFVEEVNYLIVAVFMDLDGFQYVQLFNFGLEVKNFYAGCIWKYVPYFDKAVGNIECVYMCIFNT